MKSGSWVKAYSKGIWQIVRIIPAHYGPRYALDQPKALLDGHLCLLKRIVNDQHKPAFAMEVAHSSLIRPLRKSDLAKLEKTLSSNPQLLASFREFQQPVSAIWNLRCALAKKSMFRSLQQDLNDRFRLPLQKGATSDEILRVIGQSPFAAALNQVPTSATLQFACSDYEIRGRELIYRSLKMLPG